MKTESITKQMTTTMKKQLITIAVALLTAGTLTTSCSNEDNAINTTPQTQLPDDETIDTSPQPQQPAANTITLTATLAPKGDDGGTTRAITPSTDDVTGEEILNMTWAENEEIALYYQTATGYAKTMATVQSVDATTGAATIEASLNANTTNGGVVKFVYPASLANDTGDDIDETKLLSQNGNLTGVNGISTKFDAATGEGRINLNGGTTMPTTATVTNTAGTGNVSLTNRVCICKFRCHLDAGSTLIQDEFRNVIINDGNGHTYTITSDKQDDYGIGTRYFRNTDDIYVALLPVSGKFVTFYHTTSGTSQGQSVQWNYLHLSPNTTLTAGKFYRNIGTINLVRDEYNATSYTFKDLSDGSITATTGDFIYQSSNTATANTITVTDGALFTLYNANISVTGSAGIMCEGNANIYLKGTNNVTTTALNYPAIQAGGSGKTLTIQGSGSLNATGGSNGAGIGGCYDSTCGNITICGGTITANGGDDAAGIGSGNLGTCGNITINGGNITSTGKYTATGIGCGGEGHCGNITIFASVERVIAQKGQNAPYSIGKGRETSGLPSTCGTITIGGTIRNQEEFTGKSFTYQP